MKKLIFIASFFFFAGFSELSQAQDLNVYQYWNATIHRHFYTTDYNELGAGGNGWGAYGVIAGLSSTGTTLTNGDFGRAVYRFYNTASAAHYYTMDSTKYPDGFHLEGIMGYTPPFGYTVSPVYEFYNAGDYYYSKNSQPPSGYVLDGIAYYGI